MATQSPVTQSFHGRLYVHSVKLDSVVGENGKSYMFGRATVIPDNGEPMTLTTTEQAQAQFAGPGSYNAEFELRKREKYVGVRLVGLTVGE